MSTSQANISSSVVDIAARVNTAQNNTSALPRASATGTDANALGAGSVASGNRSLAEGAGATASGNNSVAVGAGSTDDGQANVFAVGGTAAGTQRRVVNVAAGLVATGSTEAINGGQVAALSTSIDTRFVNFAQSVTTTNGGTAIGAGATTAAGASAFGNNARATSTNSLAAGNGASAAGTNSVALGANSSVTAAGTNSVAIGAGSVASDPNTVSFGAPGAERRLTNVAAGISPTDAVNVAQLNAVSNNVSTLANRVDRQEAGLRRLDRLAGRGVAIATALASIPALTSDQKIGVGFGTGTYDGRFAFSAGVVARVSDNAQFRLNAGTTGNGKVAAGGGVLFGW